MPLYRYTALTSAGKRVKGVIEAGNEAEARTLVRQHTGYVTELAPEARPQGSQRVGVPGHSGGHSAGRGGTGNRSMRDSGLSQDAASSRASAGSQRSKTFQDSEAFQRGETFQDSEASQHSDSQNRTTGPGLFSRMGTMVQGFFEPKVTTEQVVVLTRQLATLLKAGIPLDEALGGMMQPSFSPGTPGGTSSGSASGSFSGSSSVGSPGGTSSGGRFFASRKKSGQPVGLQRIISHVRERLREGGTLSQGLAAFPAVFDPTFRALVQAGEAAGTLDEVMLKLADSTTREQAVSRKLRGAMAYPVLMLLVGGLILGFLLTFVVPKVTQIFVDAKQALPMPTQILLWLTDVFVNWWLVFLFTPMAVYMLFMWMLKKPFFRARCHALQLQVPVVGDLVRCAVLGRFASTLGMLLHNSVPLLKALTIAKGVADNACMEQAADKALATAESGGNLARAFSESPMFAPGDIQLMAAGERSGQMEAMLDLIAHDNEDRALARMQVLTALMEPLMILFLGMAVGFVVLAIILPIFEMSNLVR